MHTPKRWWAAACGKRERGRPTNNTYKSNQHTFFMCFFLYFKKGCVTRVCMKMVMMNWRKSDSCGRGVEYGGNMVGYGALAVVVVVVGFFVEAVVRMYN